MKAYCFPGQGPQEPQLVTELLSFPGWQDLQPMVREITGYSIESLQYLNDTDLQSQLKRNEVASLITVLHSLCSLDSLRTHASPNALVGYSVGQFVALHLAACLSTPDLIHIVWQRSLLMNSANRERPGKMAAIIGLTMEQVESLVTNTPVVIANYNARGQYTIAGPESDVLSIMNASLEMGARKSLLINVDGAWHSPHMKPAADPFADLLSRISFAHPQSPVIDNVTGQLFSSDSFLDDIRAQLVKHLYQPVRWETGVRTLIQSGISEFIEAGYGNMLSKFGFFISRDCTFTTSGKVLKRESRNESGGDRCAA